MAVFNYDAKTVMKNGYPKIKKLGACSPNGEMTPFVWKGKLMRMELVDPLNGTDDTILRYAGIRDLETNKVIATLAEDSYFHSAYIEEDTAYILGVDMKSRDTIRIYESKDLVHWSNRVLFKNPGWVYYNTALTKGPDGYVILMEASAPEKYVGVKFTFFFASSPDLKEWTHMDYHECCFSKDHYNGGPWMRYVDGWYYVISVMELPYLHYVSYIFRTKDFKDWHVGYYNPIMMPDNNDKIISPRAADLSDELIEKITGDGFNINSSDLDMCDYNGKVYMNYLCGNQLGFYYMCEAEVEGTVADFLKSYFE